MNDNIDSPPVKVPKIWYKQQENILKKWLTNRIYRINMKNKTTPQEMGKELVESSAIAGAMKQEAQSSLAVEYFTQDILSGKKPNTFETMEYCANN